MHFFRSSSFYLLTAALAAAQITIPPDDHAHDSLLTLEAFVVTGHPDARSAFDLAQGASILAGDALQRSAQATLGETLAALPGVTSTYYGPGASRPLIRGLGGDRVRMLDNGIGSLDASNVSPDHNVSVEPLLVERIEILRGPATLLYGSSAVGGVVNVIDNRIPATAPATTLGGRAEMRFDTVAHERTGIAAVTTGSDRLAVQVNGLRTEADDVAIPDYADPANPANRGTLVNSALTTKSGSLGATGFWSAGQAGLAVSEYDTVYGVPVGEPIAIDLKQRRADFRGELTQPFGIFKSAKARLGLADYTHAEVDTTTGLPNTTFTHHAYEGRLELLQQDIGSLSGTIGFQAARSDFAAEGEEVVTPPTLTTSQAIFVLESWQIDPTLTLEFGARYEQQRIRLGAVDPLLPAYPGYAATTGGARTDRGVSLSTGAVYYPAKDYSLGLTVAWSQRLPTAQELYSNGPHAGTGAYEIGTATLGRETSLGLDLILRKRTGAVTGSIGGFVNRFGDFIFERAVDDVYFDETTGELLPLPAPTGATTLPVYQFTARDAVFYGGEAEVIFHLIETAAEHLHLDLTADYVHAQQTTDDQPLPRIPPLRFGATLRYERGAWSLGAGAQHVFQQDRVAPGESQTASYTLLNADLCYHFVLARTECEFFLHGANLGNQDARLSTSFLKEIAPLPGRNVSAGVRLRF